MLRKIFFGALAIRWLYDIVLFAAMGPAGLTGADSRGYLGNAEIMAEQWLHGDLHGWAWFGADPDRMPLYPWLVTLNVALFGKLAPLTTAMVQGVIDGGDLPADLSDRQGDRSSLRRAGRRRRSDQSDANRVERHYLHRHAVRILCGDVPRRCRVLAAQPLLAGGARNRRRSRRCGPGPHPGGALGAGLLLVLLAAAYFDPPAAAAACGAGRGHGCDLRPLHRADPCAQRHAIRLLVAD